MSDEPIRIQASEPQAAFAQLTQRYVAFVAGFGSGKSYWMSRLAVMDALMHPKVVIGCYAPDYKLIKQIVAPNIIARMEEFGLVGTWNKTDNIIKCDHPQFGEIRLYSMDDPSKIVGYELYRAHIDELDTMPKDKAALCFQKIQGRARQKVPGLDQKPSRRVGVYTTPEGFNFVYDRWGKDKQLVGEYNPLCNTYLNRASEHYAFVRASTYSNWELPDDYIESLQDSYPSNLIQAYLMGEFVNLSSGTVYYAYDRKKHNSTEKIEKGDVLYIGVDFNIGNTSATVYVRRGEAWHAVDELVKIYDTRQLISELSMRYHTKGYRMVLYPDAAGRWDRNAANSDAASVTLLEQAGHEIRAPMKNPNVRFRIEATNAAFENGKLFINHRRCPTVAECFEKQCYTEQGEPDKKSGFDHQNDASSYPIHYEMPIVKPVADIGVKFT